MGTVENSTAHYEAVIADLIHDRDRLRAEADEAHKLWKSRQQAVSDVEMLVEKMKGRLSEKTGRSHSIPHGVESSPTVEWLVGLSIADACVEVLRRASRPLTNREIHETLERQGYRVNSDNPTNNINSCLSHRTGTKGDIGREGKAWRIIEKKDDPQDISTVNGFHAYEGQPIDAGA